MLGLKSISSFVEEFDYFGVSIPFRLNGKKYHSSLLGGSIFLLFIASTIAYGVYNFYGFARYTEFNVVNTSSKTFYPKELNFSSYNLTIAIGLTINNVVNVEKQRKYFDIKMSYTNYQYVNSSNIRKKENIPLTKFCSYEGDYKQYNISNSEFNQFFLSEFYCPKLDQFSLAGQFVNDIFRFLKISIEMKDINTPEELAEVKKLFVENDIKLQLYYNDVNLNLNKLYNMTSYFLNSEFLNLDFLYSKKKNIFFTQTHIDVDYNPVISVIGDHSQFISVENTQDYFNAFSDGRYNITQHKLDNPNFNPVVDYYGNINVLATMYIRASEFSHYGKKTYYKLIELIADTSSIIQIILVLFFIVINTINEFKAIESLVLKSMKFKENSDIDNLDLMYFQEIFNRNNREKIVKEIKPLLEVTVPNDSGLKEKKGGEMEVNSINFIGKLVNGGEFSSRSAQQKNINQIKKLDEEFMLNLNNKNSNRNDKSVENFDVSKSKIINLFR